MGSPSRRSVGRKGVGDMFLFLGDTAPSWQTIQAPPRPSNAISPPCSFVLGVVTPPNIMRGVKC